MNIVVSIDQSAREFFIELESNQMVSIAVQSLGDHAIGISVQFHKSDKNFKNQLQSLVSKEFADFNVHYEQ
jgi:hypothetical protein